MTDRTQCTAKGCTKPGSNCYDGYGIYIARLCREHAATEPKMQFGRTRRFDPAYAGERMEEE